MKRFVLAVICLGFGLMASAQQTPPPTNNPATKPATQKKFTPKKDGYISEASSVVDTVVPYSKVDETSLPFVKRVWREINLTDSLNAMLSSPKSNLMAVIFEAINNGELDLFAPDDESFQNQPLSSMKGPEVNGVKSSTADTAFLGINPATGELNRANNEFFAASFPLVRIKEDWILDTKRGVFEPRIIGIAPVRVDVKTQVDNNGNPVTNPETNMIYADSLKSVVGWLYFDDLREVLVKKKVAIEFNDASGLNFDDVFIRRMFSSYITKWSNPYDTRIEDYITDPKERIMEADRYKNKLSDFQKSIWAAPTTTPTADNKAVEPKPKKGLFNKN
ncbi:MAG: gliding motility protein GldN [Pedobacter sp.]|nr:MAG: gliding motility protein GldN [Pedobacter sp.]